MALTRVKIYEDAEQIHWQEADPARNYSETVVEYKAGSTEFNRRDLVAKAANALAANQSAQTVNATYLAIATPNTAQNTAQIKALSNQQQTVLKECSALIRLLLGLLDSTAGT